MPIYDERNILYVGPPSRPGDPELTPAMVEAVVARIRDAGILSICAVLREDVYETRYGDGEYLYLRGVTFKTTDAWALADLAGKDEWVKWHVKAYQLQLENDLPSFRRPWSLRDRFTLNDMVAMVAEIPPGGRASKLHTGTGRREDGPFIELPAK